MKQRFWRFASPTTLLFALLLFPLPWIEIQCPGFMSGKNDMQFKPVAVTPAPAQPAPAPSTAPDWEVPEWLGGIVWFFIGPRRAVLVSQSGLQAACGWWSYGGEIDETKPQAARLRNAIDAGMYGSRWLAVYFWVLLAGIVAGLALRPGRRRMLVLGTIAAGAMLLAFIPLVIGFPLEQAYCEVPWNAVVEDPSALPRLAPDVLRQDIGYTAWFWMAQIAVGVVLLLQPAEWWFVHRRRAETRSNTPEPAVEVPAASA